MNDTMPSIFTSQEGEALFVEAYDEMFSLWPVPHEAVDVETRFGRTHINVSGPADAPSLLLLHAAGFSSTAWFANVGPLSQIRRTYAIDVIGDAGRSLITRRLYSWEDHADWLGDLLDGLAIEQADLLGHSQGGWMALALSIKYPKRVSKLVLLAPAASIHPFRWYVKLNLALARRMVRPDARGQLKFAAAKGAVLEERFVHLMDMVNRHCLPATMVPTVYSEDELRRASMPTLLLIGDAEKIYKPEKAIKRAGEFMLDLTAGTVPNASHLLPIEQPELVNGRIADFLV